MSVQDWMTTETARRVQSPAHLEKRARSAVAAWLGRELIVPKIYFDAEWRKGRRIDVLALDRAGMGDVHLVEIKTSLSARILRPGLDLLLATPSNYRWLALLVDRQDSLPIPRDALLNPEGMGRIGLVRVQRGPNDDLVASVEVKAERFAGSYYDRADRFSQKHKPDLQTRA